MASKVSATFGFKGLDNPKNRSSDVAIATVLKKKFQVRLHVAASHGAPPTLTQPQARRAGHHLDIRIHRRQPARPEEREGAGGSIAMACAGRKLLSPAASLLCRAWWSAQRRSLEVRGGWGLACGGGRRVAASGRHSASHPNAKYPAALPPLLSCRRRQGPSVI